MTFPASLSLSVCMHISGNRTATYLQQSLGNLMININLMTLRCFKNDMILRRTFRTPQDNPSRGFCIFQPLFASSIIHLPSVTAAKAENLGQLTGFSPGSPWQKHHSSMESCFHQVVAEVVAVLAGASDLKQLSFRRLHCTMNWAADDLLCTCDAGQITAVASSLVKDLSDARILCHPLRKMAIEAAHALAILSTKAVRRTDSITN